MTRVDEVSFSRRQESCHSLEEGNHASDNKGTWQSRINKSPVLTTIVQIYESRGFFSNFFLYKWTGYSRIIRYGKKMKSAGARTSVQRSTRNQLNAFDSEITDNIPYNQEDEGLGAQKGGNMQILELCCSPFCRFWKLWGVPVLAAFFLKTTDKCNPFGKGNSSFHNTHL